MAAAAGQIRVEPKSKPNQVYIASEVFSRNIETLCEYLTVAAKN